MSISTPEGSGREEKGQDRSKHNAGGPRPSARRNRRGAKEPTADQPISDQPEEDQPFGDQRPDPVEGDDAAADEAVKDAGKADEEEHGTLTELAKGESPSRESRDALDDDIDRASIELSERLPQAIEVPKPERIDATPTTQASGRHGLFGVDGSGDTSGMSGLVTAAGSGIPSKSSPRPFGGWFDEVADRIAQAYAGWKQAHIATIVDRGELTFYVEASHIAKLAKVLRDDPQLRFELLSSLSGVDYLHPEGSQVGLDPQQQMYAKQRLHAVYHLTSLTYRRRIRVEIATTVEDPHVPTVSWVYPTADWQERETYDMFGIIFDGHQALTRILMPDDWDGHPQRKDYPLGGISVEYKGASIPPPDQRRAYK